MSKDKPVFGNLQKISVTNKNDFAKNIDSSVNIVMSPFDNKKYQIKDNLNPSLSFNLTQ